MILCDRRKLGIFLTPRTGSTSICKHFESYSFTLNDHEHITYQELDIPDKDQYQFFAFYRDPLERFLSGMRLLLVVGKSKPELKPSTDDPLEFLLTMRAREKHTLFMQQVRWLDYPNVQALSYTEYVSNFKMLCQKFDVPFPDEIPHHNHADVPVNYGTDFVAAIREAYADDYAFFEKNRLTI